MSHPASSRLQRRAGRILRAAATPLLPRTPALEQDERAAVERELESFVARQVFAMPRYLLVPYLAALFTFEALPLLRRGRPYSALGQGERARIAATWSRSRVAQKRDLIKLVRNCSLYFFLDHPLVRARLQRPRDDG